MKETYFKTLEKLFSEPLKPKVSLFTVSKSKKEYKVFSETVEEFMSVYNKNRCKVDSMSAEEIERIMRENRKRIEEKYVQL